MVCEQIDRRTELLEQLDKAGFERPIHMTILDLEKQISSNLGLLGLTPTDRTRMGVAEVQKNNKLEEMLQRRAQRETRFTPE